MTSMVPEISNSSPPGGLTCRVSQICCFRKSGVRALMPITAYCPASTLFTAAFPAAFRELAPVERPSHSRSLRVEREKIRAREHEIGEEQVGEFDNEPALYLGVWPEEEAQPEVCCRLTAERLWWLHVCQSRISSTPCARYMNAAASVDIGALPEAVQPCLYRAACSSTSRISFPRRALDNFPRSRGRQGRPTRTICLLLPPRRCQQRQHVNVIDPVPRFQAVRLTETDDRLRAVRREVVGIPEWPHATRRATAAAERRVSDALRRGPAAGARRASRSPRSGAPRARTEPRHRLRLPGASAPPLEALSRSLALAVSDVVDIWGSDGFEVVERGVGGASSLQENTARRRPTPAR